MIVLDTSGLLAALDASEAQHDRCLEALVADPGPLLLSPFILAELDYLLRTRVGAPEQRALLDEVAAGAYRLEPFSADDVAAAGAVLDRFADLRIGLADASLAVLADRHGVADVLTLDERHFRPMRLSDGRAFRLRPLDPP